jgi:hypothetical protein
VFDGNYSWWDKRLKYDAEASSMKGILQVCGFRFDDYCDSKVKIPSIIVVNLVSPRVDYHGHDKSRIDTQTFNQTIIDAAKKIADYTRTFRAAGFRFYSEKRHDQAAKNVGMTAKDLVRHFLDRIRTGGNIDVKNANL